ncbi:MAG: inositol-3-phosphate synthase, partial [Planctomycetota bacterium]
MRATGIWLVGACGAVGTLTVAGARAIARGLMGRTGMVTELPDLREIDLPPVESLVFGGHELARRSLVEAAAEFRRNAGILPERLLDELQPDLEQVDREIRPGVAGNHGRPAAKVEAIRRDLCAFADRHALDRLVVINVATTEPLAPGREEWLSLPDLERALREDRADVFPASMLYAYAALDAGHAYVNFTPSVGASVPALEELARRRRTVHAGRDGKTGETLVKSALAPLFAHRNLRVLAWEGYNMLGNRDGEALRDPAIRRTKSRSKDRALPSILGEQHGHSSVHIDYVPSLHDWKVAWDFIHFEGFLGAKMSMQFTWQGCDSALAAPLVLDLGRLAAFAKGRGEAGATVHGATVTAD